MNETERFWAWRPVIARCRCCGQLLAEYIDGDGWSAVYRCGCDPPRQPALPEGIELADLIARAGRRRHMRVTTRK